MANEHVPLRFDGQVISVLGLGPSQLVTASVTHKVTTTFGAKTHVVRVVPAQHPIYYSYGVDPTADAVGAGIYLPADAVEYVKVAPGDIMSVIQFDTAAAASTLETVVSVTEVN